jgi:hypothetical protein
VQSEAPPLDYLENIKANSLYECLPNLATHFNKWTLPSAAVCRNYSRAFQLLESTKENYDYAICILGDTLIYNWSRLISHLERVMLGKQAGVLQAIGQNFHSRDADPVNGKFGGRFQHEDITDIMPQFFVLRPSVGFLSNIPIDNPYTTEENLGNELARRINFSTDVVRLNGHGGAYDFREGVSLQW